MDAMNLDTWLVVAAVSLFLAGYYGAWWIEYLRGGRAPWA